MTLTFDTHLTSLAHLFEYLKKVIEAYGFKFPNNI